MASIRWTACCRAVGRRQAMAIWHAADDGAVSRNAMQARDGPKGSMRTSVSKVAMLPLAPRAGSCHILKI
jgi:hypothetical protein